MPELHEYTKKLKSEIERTNQRVRGRNSVSEQAHIATSRIDEILAGSKPTEQEHRGIVRAIPTMRYYQHVHAEWLKKPDPPLPAPNSQRTNGTAPTGIVFPERGMKMVEYRVETSEENGITQVISSALPPPPLTLFLVPKTFGEYLRAAREQKGWTFAMLAEKVGCVESTVRNWENDIGCPVSSNYEAILISLPALAEPGVPRPESRNIQKPSGRAALETQEDPTRSMYSSESASATQEFGPRATLIQYGLALGRTRALLEGRNGKGARAAVVALLRAGCAAGLSAAEIADSMGHEP